MSIANIIDSIRVKIDSKNSSIDFDIFNTKIDETSNEYIQATFLTPSTQFSNQWLNNLQEYVVCKSFFFLLTMASNIIYH